MTTRHQRCFDLTRLIVVLLAFFFVNQVYALGLGNLKVLSALDEPLVAEIELKSVTESELESLEVNLGSAEDFQRAGIDREAFLGQLEFRVRKVGNPAIRINTTQPVKEPFLHFLIRAEWSDGKLIREYTALLDPPLYAAQQSIAVNTPDIVEQPEQGSGSMSVAQQPTVTQQPEVESEPVPQPQAQTSVSEFSGAEYGLTERGDTLWNIASRLDVRGSDANIFQIMIALLRENPQAFVDNNINRLKVGQILRLSDLDSVSSISKGEASSTYQTQLAEWESYKMALAETSGVMKVPAPDTASAETPAPATESAVATAPSETEPETTQAAPEETTTQAPAAAAEPTAEEATPEIAEATPEVAETTPEVTETAPEPAAESAAESTPESAAAESATAEQDLLKIVRATLEQEEGEVAGAPGAQAEIDAVKAAADKEIATLRDQISTIEEALVSSELQNKQLTERITLLEGQVENAQRLVELESQELALAQQQAAEAQAQATQAQQQATEAQQQAVQAQEQITQVQQEAAQAEQQAADRVAQAEQQAAQQVAEAEQQALQAQQQAAQVAQQTPAVPQQQADQAEQQTSQEAAATRPEQAVIEPITEQQSAAQPVVQRSSKAWWESLLDTFVGSSMTIIAAVVGILVLLVALLLIMRRRRSIAEFEESILSGSALDGQTETTDTEATGTGTDTSFLSDFGMAGMGTMQADEVDPLAEAEVYLAYGRDEQAEEVLKEAAGRDPSRHELKLKLLEIYQQRNDLNSFETLAEELYPAGEQGDAETWNKVIEMGLKMNPNNPLFSQEVPSAVEESLTESISETLEQPKVESLDQEMPAEPPADTLEEVLATSPTSESLENVSEESEALTELDSLESTPVADDVAEVRAQDDEQTSDTLDSSLQPFPAPDQNVGLDEELDRLGKQMEETAVSMSAEEPDEKKSSDDAEMLNFATTDPSELDFDIDLEEPTSDTQDLDAKPTQAAAEDALKEDLIDFDLELSEESEMALKESQIGEESDSVEQGEGGLDQDFVGLGDAQDQNLDEASFELEPTSLDSDSDTENAGEDEAETEQWDEAATKLDLAQAYLNMGDKAGARSIIDEVLKEGSPAQKDQAAELAAQIN